MIRGHLLDASALLALLFDEPGAETVLDLIDDCSIHAVNLSEMLRKILQTGLPASQAEPMLDSLDLEINATFSPAEAFAAARLAFNNRRVGLSLGDAVCLSVASHTGQTVLTADRRWSELAADLPEGRRLNVRQIR